MVLRRFRESGKVGLWQSVSAVLAGLCCLCLASTATALDWVVEAKEAKQMLEEASGEVTILDVRSKRAFRQAHLERAQRVTWQEFSRASGKDHGELLRKDSVLQHRLRRAGVSDDVPVLVVGDPLEGWGEEGRIVWMLRTLGHEKAALVDGGHEALVGLGLEIEKGEAKKVAAGDFQVRRTSAFSVTRREVKASLESKEATFIDTREAREFAGKTPYGEARGGHLPGAWHLYFSDLLDERGEILEPAQIEARLRAMGITRKTQPIIAYCTGGIRSAWVVAVLQDAGYTGAKNYAGSMWQWAAASEEEHPLEKEAVAGEPGGKK